MVKGISGSGAGFSRGEKHGRNLLHFPLFSYFVALAAPLVAGIQ